MPLVFKWMARQIPAGVRIVVTMAAQLTEQSEALQHRWAYRVREDRGCAGCDHQSVSWRGASELPVHAAGCGSSYCCRTI